MKRLIGLLIASGNLAAQTLPMTPVSVDCRYAVQMSQDLEKIIANPSSTNQQWDKLFASISGNQTDQQRISSAKVVLWSIRTNCTGF